MGNSKCGGWAVETAAIQTTSTPSIDRDPTLWRWAAMKAELAYRYTRLLGGALLT